MDAFYARIADFVGAQLGRPASEVLPLLGAPKNPEHGDVALPCFKLAQLLGRTGKDAAPGLAAELAAGLAKQAAVVKSAEAAGPFVNVRLHPAAVAREVLEAVVSKTPYGGSDEGAGRTIVIDFTSPNIAKPFHLGHLRSTVIGWSLRQIFRTLGYRVVGVNHLGDWGTQFGLMIAAWKRWGAEAEQKIAAGARDISVFVELYVRINELKKQDPAVAEEGRSWFLKLEQGDVEAHELWAFFVERSKAEFGRILDILGIVHESDCGEAFYNDKMPAMVQLLERSGLLVEGKSRQEELEEAKVTLERETKGQADLQAALAGAKDDKAKKDIDKKLGKAKDAIAKATKRIKDLAAQLAAPPDDDDAGPADRRPRGVEVDLGGGKTAFAMLLKGDGGSTYTTRDLTAAKYRSETYHPDQSLYVVGNTQRDHFLPWFKVVEKLAALPGNDWARGPKLTHVGFGNYLGMSTRKGTAVFLDEVLERGRVAATEAAERADKKMALDDAQKATVARAIGIGALKFFDLRAERNKDIDLGKCNELCAGAAGKLLSVMPAGTKVGAGEVVAVVEVEGQARELEAEIAGSVLVPDGVSVGMSVGPKDVVAEVNSIDWDRLLELKGDTGPYLMFAHARLCGILRKAEVPATAEGVDWSLLGDPEALALVKTIGGFPAAIRQAAADHEPSVISRYLLGLSTAVHQFVHVRRVLNPEPEGAATAEQLTRARILLVAAARKVMAEALDLLGIEALEVM